MNKKLIASSVLATLLAFPVVSMAAFNPGGVPNQLNLTIGQLVDIIFGIIWPIFIAFAIIMFILAAFLFLTAQGDPDKVAQGRNAIIWGTVGVAVAVLAFSIPFVVRTLIPGA